MHCTPGQHKARRRNGKVLCHVTSDDKSATLQYSPTLHSQFDTTPNNDRQQDHAEQQKPRLLPRRRALQHKRKQRRAARARCPERTHLERGAPHRLPRPQQARAALDDVQREWEPVRVRREDELGARARGGPRQRLGSCACEEDELEGRQPWARAHDAGAACAEVVFA
jgi:hypothetical protein